MTCKEAQELLVDLEYCQGKADKQSFEKEIQK